MNGLVKNKFGIYRFRTRIPSYAVRFFNKSEINKSLQTKNHHLAEMQASIYYNEFKKIIRVIKQKMVPDIQIEELVNNFIIDTLKQDKIDRATLGYGIEGASCTDSVEFLNYMIHEGKEYLAHSNYSFVEDTTKQILDTIGIQYDNSDKQHRLLLQRVMRGQIEIFEEALRRSQGNFSKRYDLSQSTAREVEGIISFQKAYDNFKVYYNDKIKSKPTLDDTYRVLDKFIVMVGASTSVENISLTELIGIKQKIKNLPNW